MLQRPQDSATSWEQRSWEFAVERFVQLSQLRQRTKTESIRQYCDVILTQLQKQYPQLVAPVDA